MGKLQGTKRIRELLKLGQVRSEKCELKEAGEAYHQALKLAKRAKDLRATTEAISGLLRLAGEALDYEAIRRWDSELDRLISAHPKKVSPLVWYCKGAVAIQKEEWKLAQRHFHRYLRAVRGDSAACEGMPLEEHLARAWSCLANIQRQRGHIGRGQWLCEEILRRYEARQFRSINGLVYLMLGTICERQRDYPAALRWFQKAHASFLSEHNWYHHLYVLYGYARIARVEQNYSQAYWYLDLIDKAASGPEFGILRREIAQERSRLEQDAIDLLIDSRKGIIKTREGEPVSIRKQYVLLNILEALSDADRGLSKAEIIEKVWHERYRPEAHDNKLYYNINRLRKLIEPDVRKPQYLLNWKEGYRLAPGLRCIVWEGDPNEAFSVVLGIVDGDREREFRGESSGGRGHDVPSPFGSANQKVELADGEPYVLLGRVFISEDRAYLEVDLTAHPWLASEKRKVEPFYALEGGAIDWGSWENQPVQVSVKAHGQIRVSAEKGAQYSISLEPLSDPVPVKR